MVATPATEYTQCRLEESQVVSRYLPMWSHIFTIKVVYRYFSVATSPYIGRPEVRETLLLRELVIVKSMGFVRETKLFVASLLRTRGSPGTELRWL